ncbi:hypothetical protein Rhow_005639 [Rhodococcus wratislaviensis]|uniref:Uncharacterized protein n=1 Tax=Rhodococcus wratislaviensis TaxID=44752 RepID=A0A402CEE6_RHOWR|nr:hypothetical protein Rhow_005639 [Rhodococcus wratislaviensis]
MCPATLWRSPREDLGENPTRTAHPALTVNNDDSVPLQSTIGLTLVERMLAHYNATLASTI